MASVPQRLYMVTLHGDLLIFQLKHPKSRGSEIIFWRMSFNRDSGTFLNKDDKITPVYENASRAVSIVHCTAAVNRRTRQRALCILLRLHRKGSQGFKYMLYSLSSRTSAKLHVEFSLPYEMGKDVSIFHGPTLVWSHQDVVFYTSAETGSVKEVPIRLKVNFLGELPLPQRPIAALGLQMTEEEMGNDAEDKTVLYFLEDGRTFSAGCLLPSAYSLVVRCMLVLSAKEEAGSLRSTVVAATCRRQLVCFENGLPEEVCPLPYEEPRSIRTVHTGSGCLIVVVFEHGNVCAVWKDTFKVAVCWTDVSLLLVDDFLGAGFEQMLLLFEDIDSADGFLGKFLLTDLCGISYSHGRAESEDVNRCETAEENITLTIQALEARLQSGLAFLQDLQRDLHVKDHVIQQCVSALRDLLSDRKHVASPALQEGLVSLFDEQSDEDECTPYVRMETNSDESLLKVERVWHRVIGHRLVFGALLAPTNHIQFYRSSTTAAGVRVVQDMYERSRTVVRCAVGQTEEFKVEVGLHQGSALSPFLFAIVMDQLSEEVRQESPWTMMFADDIVICSESREQMEENLERWRFALERRGMKVSRSKTEYMCVNEREGSGTVRIQGEEVKKVQEFKYLGSTVQSNGECGKEVKKRVQAGWNGWRKVSGVLCDKKISARIKGKVYRTVVRPAMLYGLETVSLRKRQESELEVAELKMLRTESENMIAAVIATPPMVQSVNKIICYPEPLTSAEPGPPNAKRSKFPSGPAILIITDLAPLLTFDPIKCSVLLCFSTREAGSAFRHCELVNLDLKGALEGKFQPLLYKDCSIDSDESREDLLSLMAAFESWRFHIVSNDHTVVDVLRFLEEKFRAKRLNISPQYLLCCSAQPSGAMLFHWKPCNSFDGMLEVYCSDQLGLLHFLDTLCNFLPVSHRIKLLKTGQGRNRSPALSMEHEIRTIKEGVVDLIHGGVEYPSSGISVHISREQWLKEQRDQLHPLVEVKLYHRLVERTINLEMASDVAMLMEVELNEY
ncbi:hypothetical protein QTP86_025431 [Hemibagrus guttatus]|nr:hypothetical protein QTP86_025431 [Hemibagrus guttatus]